MTTTPELDRFESRLSLGATCMGIELPAPKLLQMMAHADALMTWNRKMNLTAIRDPESVAEKHFLDALAVSSRLSGGERVMDMGAGGGFPSIPLKVMHPEGEFLLVDAVRKKVNFLSHVIRTLGLSGIEARHARVEDLALEKGVAGTFDVVISRGFARLDVFVSHALPMLSPGGSVWAMKGEDGLSEITPALEADFHISHVEYTLPFEKAGRMLICLAPEKQSRT